MAEKIVSPGVFTSEIDASFLPAAISEIGAAVVGPTVKGPAGIPTVVSSISEFEAKFGTTFKSGSDYQQYLTSHTVREYLKNSNQVTVVRILAGSYSQASSSIANGGTISAASAASASLTINEVPSGSATELTINGVDFVSVVSASLFDNSTSERYFNGSSVENGNDIDKFGALLAASINTAESSSLVLCKAQYNSSNNKLTLIATNSGSSGNITVTTSSVEPAQNQKVYTADVAGNYNLQGGTSATNAGVSFKLHTHADGTDQNSTGGTEGTNNVLSNGTKDNLRWEIPSKNNKQGTFNLLIRRGDDTIKRKTVLETWNNLSLDPESPNYIAKRIGDSKMTLRTDENLNPYLQASGSFPNNSKYVRAEVVTTTPDYLDSNGKVSGTGVISASLPNLASGSFGSGLDGNIQHPRNMYHNITSTNSQGLNLSNSGGANGYDDYITALNLLANQDEYDINMILLPGVIDNLHSGIVEKAINVCETRGDCFVVADPVEYGMSVTDATGRSDNTDSSYASMYWPWIQVPDNTLNKNVWVPPSTVMGGIIAFNDKVAHPWFAPAGLNRGGIDVAVQAERKLTQADRDTLYESQVNPIATFPGQGVVVFGQKTLQKKASALDRVNVRRLLIRVKKFIASSSRFLVFEQNTASTRRRFLNIVNPFLEQVQANSGLNAFRVVMDETNNTPDIVDRNILYGQIFVQPTRTAEFIVLDFTVQPTGATFPE